MNFFTLSDKGMVRPNNEDYAESVQMGWCGPFGNLEAFTGLLLADGMGGAAAGEFASLLAVKTIKMRLVDGIFKRPPEELLNTDLQDFLSSCCKEANIEIYKKSRENLDMEGMGTTIVAALIFREMLTLCHVGDSRCYLFREGKLRQLSHDHSLVQELIDQGKITQEQAQRHPNKNVITRALGVTSTVEPDCVRIPIFSGDVLLLCSDGLTGFAEESSILKIMRDQADQRIVDLKRLAETLIQLANFGGGGDNVSVVVYRHWAG